MTQLARQTNEIREQLLRQTAEAAALDERTRIARDLHDSIKQQIFSISISAAAAKAQWEGNTTNTRDSVNDIQRTAREAQVEMQALQHPDKTPTSPSRPGRNLRPQKRSTLP